MSHIQKLCNATDAGQLQVMLVQVLGQEPQALRGEPEGEHQLHQTFFAAGGYK